MTLAVDIQLFADVYKPPPKYVGWRVLHKVEGGWPATPAGLPEVMPPLNYKPLKMTRSIQLLSYDIMWNMNPTISINNWTAVHDHDRAFTNGQGFGDSSDPRVNYLTGENLFAEEPKYDKAQRVCGGSFIRGDAVGDKLICRPGIHGIDPNNLPTMQEVIERNWFIYAVSTGANDESAISHFPQGHGLPVVIPFIFENDIEFELKYFQRWEGDELPDPLRVYL